MRWNKKNNPFYEGREWRRLRKVVLQADKYECQQCKSRGKYTKANTVHHVKHLEHYPELGLERYYTDEDGKRQKNLISLCHLCHLEIHNYQHKPKEPLTEERWD